MKTPILIVDANAETLRTIQKVLTSESLVLHFAQSEDEALREVLATRFSLVLIATDMPLMSGGEVVRLLRKVKKGFSAPILLLETKVGTLPEDLELFDLGVIDSLSFPWSFITLKNKVELFARLDQQRSRIQALLTQIQRWKTVSEGAEKEAAINALQAECEKILLWGEQGARGENPSPHPNTNL